MRTPPWQLSASAQTEFDGKLSDYLVPSISVKFTHFDNLVINADSCCRCGGGPPFSMQPGDRGWINILEDMDIEGTKTIVDELTVFTRLLLLVVHMLVADVGTFKVPCFGWASMIAYHGFSELFHNPLGGTSTAAFEGDFGFKVLISSDPGELEKKLYSEIAECRLAMMATFFRDGFFDPFGFTADGRVASFRRRRQHQTDGRFCRWATTGLITPEITAKLPSCLSSSAGSKFKGGPSDWGTISKVPSLDCATSMIALDGLCELSQDQSAGTAAAEGSCGFMVLTSSNAAEGEKELSTEIIDGRLAMTAIIGMSSIMAGPAPLRESTVCMIY